MQSAEDDVPGSVTGEHDERRISPRRRVLKSAKVVYNGGHSVLDSTLQDISETGARIRLLSPTALPDEFELHLSDGRKLRVETVWATGAMLGVRFVGQKAATRQPGAAILERISEIEFRLAELRRELMAQLRD